MRTIMELVEMIDDELAGAKTYAEKYVELKSRGDEWSSRFHKMSDAELEHATYIHDFTIDEIDRLEKVFKPTSAMKEKWQKSHQEYVEKMAWIRQMLSM